MILVRSATRTFSRATLAASPPTSPRPTLAASVIFSQASLVFLWLHCGLTPFCSTLVTLTLDHAAYNTCIRLPASPSTSPSRIYGPLAKGLIYLGFWLRFHRFFLAIALQRSRIKPTFIFYTLPLKHRVINIYCIEDKATQIVFG